MPVRAICPNCSRELTVHDESIGRQVSCPGCNTLVRVTPLHLHSPATPPPVVTQAGLGQTQQRSSGLEPPPVSQTPSTAPAQQGKLSAAPLGQQLSSTGAALPRQTSRPAVGPSGRDRQAAPQRDQIAPKQSNQVTSEPATVSTLRHPSQRVAKSARFVTEGATDRINLGADGQLPELIVQEGKTQGIRGERMSSSNPLLLVAVLSMSAGLSVLLLMIEPDPTPSPSATRAAARKHLERYYIGEEPIYPYQRILREALWASSRGDEQTARRLYRRVLDRIHSEDNSDSIGLTGPKIAIAPPTDRDLEEKLSLLLSDQ